MYMYIGPAYVIIYDDQVEKLANKEQIQLHNSCHWHYSTHTYICTAYISYSNIHLIIMWQWCRVTYQFVYKSIYSRMHVIGTYEI
jgi:hypothetical protein